MPERLFLFSQLEFPWELGPPDGRYLLRASSGGQPEHVLVLETLAGERAPARRSRGRLGGRAAEREPGAPPQAPRGPTARVTIVDAVPVSAEGQAQAWLSELDPEQHAEQAVALLNRVLFLHRIACADPYVREVSSAQALVVRLGWGEGEQVADGRWLHARELSRGGRGRRRWRGGRAYSLALRPGERLAQLLGNRGQPLLCEELALRARQDIDQGRVAHAALELEHAYALGLRELRAERREDLATRVSELEGLQAGVSEQARAVRAGSEETLDEEVLTHALMRLEAALRARTAAGLEDPAEDEAVEGGGAEHETGDGPA